MFLNHHYGHLNVKIYSFNKYLNVNYMLSTILGNGFIALNKTHRVSAGMA